MAMELSRVASQVAVWATVDPQHTTATASDFATKDIVWIFDAAE